MKPGYLVLFAVITGGLLFITGAEGSKLSVQRRYLGKFAPTFYRILDERSPEWPREPATVKLLTVKGKLISLVGQRFKHHLDIEGSARLRDGRIVNFDQKIQGSWRYSVERGAPFGLGEAGYKLIPYRTLAVDPNVIKIGTVLYIPSLVGVKLPSGEVHDGFFLAQDTGQGIRGKRIDVFVGFENDEENSLTRSGRIEDMKPLSIFQVEGETAIALNERFRKQFEHHRTSNL